MKKVIIIQENLFQKRLVDLIVNGMRSDLFKRPGMKERKMVSTKRGERLAHQHLEKIE